ncbi:General transcription factor IIH subunit 3, partial [Geodia barretti]
MVYPVAGREEAGLQETEETTSGKYEPLVHMNRVLTEEIRKTVTETASHPVHSTSALSGALSKCLCYIQRRCREAPLGTKVNSRILV